MSAGFAGALGERILVQRRAPGRDDLGGAAGEWSAGVALWAGLAPLPDADRGEADRPRARSRWRAAIRSGADVAAGDRLLWRGRAFAVRAVEADPAAPERLTLTLEEQP